MPSADFTIETRLNTALSWVFLTLITSVGVWSAVTGDVMWTVFTATALTLLLIPNVARRSARFLLPWELLFLVTLPLLGHVMGSSLLANQVTTVFGVAGLALAVAVELDRLTAVKMTSGFAILFTVVTALAAAGFWSVVLWLSDVFRGTAFIPSNAALMQGFIGTLLAGVLAGVVFDQYFRRRFRETMGGWFT